MAEGLVDILDGQAVKLLQCLDKDLVVCTVRIERGNFPLEVVSNHTRLHLVETNT